MDTPDTTAVPLPDSRPLEDLRDSGMLWLLNRVAFHPRGIALALDVDTAGKVVGWRLIGDGTEPFCFDENVDKDAFTRAEATLRQHLAADGA